MCPLNATKSGPAGSGRCGASWAASSTTGTPRAWAAAQISSTGGSHPVTLEAPVSAQELGRAPVVEDPHDVVDAEGAVGAALDPAAGGDAGPRQQVGVVLDDGRHDDVVGVERQAVGQVVHRLGRVADEHDHVAAGRRPAPPPPPGEAEGAVARRLVGRGGAPGLVAGASMHARVPRQELG